MTVRRFLLRIEGLGDGPHPEVVDLDGKPVDDPTGRFVVDGDADATQGRGFLRLTRAEEKARQFETGLAAMEFLRTQGKVVPYRDGKPWRPFLTFHAEIVPIEVGDPCGCELRDRQWNPLTDRCETCGGTIKR